MKLKHSIIISLLILSLSHSAWAAPTNPGEAMATTFASVKQFKAEEPSAEQVKQAKTLLLSLLDRPYLREKVLSGVTVELTNEQKDELFGAIIEQISIGTLKSMAKNSQAKKDKPVYSETFGDKSATVLYNLDTARGKREVTCIFALVDGKYLMRDLSFGKHSMVTMFQKQLKKSFKRNTYPEVLEKLKKHGFEAPPEEPESQPAQ